MKISIEVKRLEVQQLIKILDTVEAETSFLIEDDGREFMFGELIKSQGVKD